MTWVRMERNRAYNISNPVTEAIQADTEHRVPATRLSDIAAGLRLPVTALRRDGVAATRLATNAWASTKSARDETDFATAMHPILPEEIVCRCAFPIRRFAALGGQAHLRPARRVLLCYPSFRPANIQSFHAALGRVRRMICFPRQESETGHYVQGQLLKSCSSPVLWDLGEIECCCCVSFLVTTRKMP